MKTRTRTYGIGDMSRALGGVRAQHIRAVVNHLPEPVRRQPRLEWDETALDAVSAAVASVAVPVSRLLADTTPRSAARLSADVPVMPGSIRRLVGMGLLPDTGSWAPADLVPLLETMRKSRMTRLVTIRGVDHVAPYAIMHSIRTTRIANRNKA